MQNWKRRFQELGFRVKALRLGFRVPELRRRVQHLGLRFRFRSLECLGRVCFGLCDYHMGFLKGLC